MDFPNLDKFNEMYANVHEDERELVLEACNSAVDALRKNIRFVFDETTKRFKVEKDPLKNYSDHDDEDDYDDEDDDVYTDDDAYTDDDVEEEEEEKPVVDVVEEEEKPTDVLLSKMSDDHLELQIKNLTDVVASMSCNSQDESEKHQVELDSLLAERECRLLSLYSR